MAKKQKRKSLEMAGEGATRGKAEADPDNGRASKRAAKSSPVARTKQSGKNGGKKDVSAKIFAAGDADSDSEARGSSDNEEDLGHIDSDVSHEEAARSSCEESDLTEESGEQVGKEKGLKAKVKGPLTIKKLSNFKKKQDRTGVVYISRVPPYMKPEKVRHLLGKHAKVGRVFLTPEDPAVRKKRKAMGGNKRQSYVDGWIEFDDKRDAKHTARKLNTTLIGGRSTSFFSSDIWNLKYLSKFKWHHLTEKIAYDNAVRRAKLQAEISQAKREKEFYLERVDQSKRLHKKSNKNVGESGEANGDGAVRNPVKENNTALRSFRQKQSIDSRAGSGQTGEMPPQKISGLLGRLFGQSQ